VYALGYPTAECHVVDDERGARFLSIRHPSSRDKPSEPALALGPTHVTATRPDDPNDKIDHEARRSLRALSMVGRWIELDQVRAEVLQDVYVGAKDQGYVEHQVVALDAAFGAATLSAALHQVDPDRPPKNISIGLITLGFSPKERPDPTQTPTPSVGFFGEAIDFDAEPFAVPFPPADQALPSDRYWIAKRIAAISKDVLGEAVAASKLDDASQRYLLRTLWARRDATLRFAMTEVSPLEVVRVVGVSDGIQITLTDVAIKTGVASKKETRYMASMLDESGDTKVEPFALEPQLDQIEFTIPREFLELRDYVIVTAEVERNGVRAPRGLQLHLAGSSTSRRLVGVRH
jgi:hypothetical protein